MRKKSKTSSASIRIVIIKGVLLPASSTDMLSSFSGTILFPAPTLFTRTTVVLVPKAIPMILVAILI